MKQHLCDNNQNHCDFVAMFFEKNGNIRENNVQGESEIEENPSMKGPRQGHTEVGLNDLTAISN